MPGCNYLRGTKMKIDKRENTSIIRNIFSDEYEADEKLNAIQNLTWADDINHITKADLICALRWLLEEYI